MLIAELYRSRQGEGELTGTDSVFLRTSGCNLRCRFCDTPFTSWSPEGENLSIETILERLHNYPCRHVVITGGEPMLFSELLPLCTELRQLAWHITIETAGTRYLPVECDLMSISPKMSNSTPSREEAPQWQERHEQTRRSPEVVQKLVSEYRYQLKFVIDQPTDCDEVEDYLAGIPEVTRDRVWLMPQGTSLEQLQRVGEWLEPLCRQQGFHYCPRKQIEWYGFTRGT